MKLLTAAVSNLASYANLTFKFNDLGLALIQGATGSGKSTLNAIPAWILFGVSSKNGNVDEIRNWKHLDAPTTGSLELVTDSGTHLTVTRIRGRSNENDLYIQTPDSADKIRGKDLTDTQCLINETLGMNAEEYLLACNFNEFSEAGLFFTSKAKEKRELFEKLAKLDLPIKLETGISEYKKSLKKTIDNLSSKIAKIQGSLEELNVGLNYSIKSSNSWINKQKILLDDLLAKNTNFDTSKIKSLQKLEAKLQSLEEVITSDNIFATKIGHLKELLTQCNETKCDSCGSPLGTQQKLEYQKDITLLREAQIENSVHLTNKSNILEQIAATKAATNTFQEEYNREKAKENPFLNQIEKCKVDIQKKTEELNSSNKALISVKQSIQSADLLKDLSYNLRASLLQQAISNIQSYTNKYLEEYFDAELRISFQLQDDDKLLVGIQNNGYDCVYTQLSKGQRQLLRLTFAISVMEVAANKLGTHIESIFLDEALDGLDASLKLKAFRLLQHLSTKHNTVLVVDHATEFHELFDTKYLVELNNDESTIEGISE